MTAKPVNIVVEFHYSMIHFNDLKHLLLNPTQSGSSVLACRAVGVPSPAGDIVLCSRSRHSRSATLHSGWVTTNLMFRSNPAMDYNPVQCGSISTPSRFLPLKPARMQT